MVDGKDIKLITVDFDGTLLQRDQIWISPRNMRALKECQRRGILCVPCTGRSADMFPPQIDTDPTFRYWITCCGARVEDRLSGEVVYKSTFTPHQTAEICRLYEEMGIYSEVAAEGRLYFEKTILDELWKYPVPPHHVWYMSTGKPIPIHGRMSDFFLEQNIGAEKFNLYGVPLEFQNDFNERLKKLSFVEFKDGSLRDVQILSTATNRIEAVEVLLARLGISFDNVLSIGDSAGMDGMMIKKAAIGITLENASDECKSIADYITASYDEDGFAKAIEELVL